MELSTGEAEPKYCRIVGIGKMYTLDRLVRKMNELVLRDWIPVGIPFEHKYKADCGPEWCIVMYRPPSAGY